MLLQISRDLTCSKLLTPELLDNTGLEGDMESNAAHQTLQMSRPWMHLIQSIPLNASGQTLSPC
jgi:hypothetical protein